MTTSVPVNITASEQTVGNFAPKGSASSISIDPFRSYLKDNGGVAFVTITNQDDSVVTLYGLKKVELIQGETPDVRVTNADDSTVTLYGLKKVEFKKE